MYPMALPALVLLPFPSTLPEFIQKDIRRLRKELANPDIVRWDVSTQFLEWRANDEPVPPSVFTDAYVVCTPKQRQAHDDRVDAAIKAYRAQQVSSPPDPEERFEAPAAHGPGVELVDVISGRRWTT